MNRLLVKSIFYTLAGEGANAGKAVIFIRLVGCNQTCWFCDTDHTGGVKMSAPEILLHIKQYKQCHCHWIVWTGGEPTLQLTEEDINFFKEHGFKQAIETNGSNPVPAGLDYITVSPKVDTDTLRINFSKVNEIRYPVGVRRNVAIFPPKIELLPKSDFYYISPLFLGEKHKRLDLDEENLRVSIEFVKKNPQWRLSIQQQKVWKIL